MDFEAKLSQVFAEENAQPEQWWYLSFADEAGFKGVAIVRGRGVLTASLTAESHGANPGGEVLAFPIGDEGLPGPSFRNRLLSKADVNAAYASTGGGVSFDPWSFKRSEA